MSWSSAPPNNSSRHAQNSWRPPSPSSDSTDKSHAATVAPVKRESWRPTPTSSWTPAAQAESSTSQRQGDRNEVTDRSARPTSPPSPRRDSRVDSSGTDTKAINDRMRDQDFDLASRSPRPRRDSTGDRNYRERSRDFEDRGDADRGYDRGGGRGRGDFRYNQRRFDDRRWDRPRNDDYNRRRGGGEESGERTWAAWRSKVAESDNKDNDRRRIEDRRLDEDRRRDEERRRIQERDRGGTERGGWSNYRPFDRRDDRGRDREEDRGRRPSPEADRRRSDTFRPDRSPSRLSSRLSPPPRRRSPSPPGSAKRARSRERSPDARPGDRSSIRARDTTPPRSSYLPPRRGSPDYSPASQQRPRSPLRRGGRASPDYDLGGGSKGAEQHDRGQGQNSISASTSRVTEDRKRPGSPSRDEQVKRARERSPDRSPDQIHSHRGPGRSPSPARWRRDRSPLPDRGPAASRNRRPSPDYGRRSSPPRQARNSPPRDVKRPPSPTLPYDDPTPPPAPFQSDRQESSESAAPKAEENLSLKPVSSAPKLDLGQILVRQGPVDGDANGASVQAASSINGRVASYGNQSSLPSNGNVPPPLLNQFASQESTNLNAHQNFFPPQRPPIPSAHPVTGMQTQTNQYGSFQYPSYPHPYPQTPDQPYPPSFYPPWAPQGSELSDQSQISGPPPLQPLSNEVGPLRINLGSNTSPTRGGLRQPASSVARGAAVHQFFDDTSPSTSQDPSRTNSPHHSPLSSKQPFGSGLLPKVDDRMVVDEAVAVQPVDIQTDLERLTAFELEYTQHHDSVAPYIQNAFKDWNSRDPRPPLTAFLNHYFGRQPNEDEMKQVERLLALRSQITRERNQVRTSPQRKRLSPVRPTDAHWSPPRANRRRSSDFSRRGRSNSKSPVRGRGNGSANLIPIDEGHNRMRNGASSTAPLPGSTAPPPPPSPPAPDSQVSSPTRSATPEKASPPAANFTPVIPFNPDETYQRLDCVGEGTYGKVYKARNVETGVYVALKRIRMEGEKDGFPVTAMREIKLLQSLSHQNVISLHEMMVSKGSVHMVFEYMEHDLTGLLSHQTLTFSPANIKSLNYQMISGLEYLHRKGILHRDMKGSNILLNAAGVLKLADFGLARLYNRKRKADYTNRVITLWYRSPELLLGETAYGPEVDMWSAGCIMLEMFTTKPIFQGNDEIHQLEVIYGIMGTPNEDDWPGVKELPWYELVRPRQEIEPKFREQFTKWLSPAALDIAGGLLAFNPVNRLSASAALKSPYFTLEEPRMEVPRQLGNMGEHHEMSAKQERQRRKMASR